MNERYPERKGIRKSKLRSAISAASLGSMLLVSEMAAGATPTMIKDIEFLEPARTEKMDAYFPPEKFIRPVPAVILIHGGGWTVGDKAGAREKDIGNTLSAHGYAVFSINYALNQISKDKDGNVSRKIAWPQNLYDCKSALRFVRANAQRFGIDPTRIAAMGGSAGGHLAMLMGSTVSEPTLNRGGLYTEIGNQVTCVITFYGRHDVRERAPAFAGATEEETRANIVAASPVTYFNAATPPMLIVHGTADLEVPVEISRALAQELRSWSVDYLYLEIGGAPHTFDLHPPQMNLEPVVVSFLEKHLARSPSKAYGPAEERAALPTPLPRAAGKQP